ncbi:rod-binding protein [Candidatus Sumerlaeota bacterium]|nr:rod-binding protein [Candidatus Sumerlaeota bacterium]
MSDFAIQSVMGTEAEYDARTVGTLAGTGTTSYLEAMNLGHLEGKGAGLPDTDRVLVEFQGFLMHEMLKAMRASIPPSEIFGENSGRELFESLLDGEYARSVSEKTGGLGLTETLRIQLGIVENPAERPELPAVGQGR